MQSLRDYCQARLTIPFLYITGLSHLTVIIPVDGSSLRCKQMLLSNLPDDVLLLVADQLQSTRDVNSLLQSNRRICSLLTPALYQLNVDKQQSSALFQMLESDKLESILALHSRS